MKRVNMHEAKTHLSRYVSELRSGESLIICNRNQPVADLRPLGGKPAKPRIGVAKGEFDVPEAFFEPLPDELVNLFNGRKGV